MNINPGVSSVATTPAGERNDHDPGSALRTSLIKTENVPLLLSRQDSLLNVSIPDAVDSRLSDLLIQELTVIGNLSLRRSNRPDLAHRNNGSIHASRRAILNECIASSQSLRQPDTTDTLALMNRQRQYAKITFEYYQKKPGMEAFCQEHAEMVLHRLTLRGKGDRALLLRIYDIRSASSHIVVLYANAPAAVASELFRPLAESRHTAPLTFQPAGMELKQFANYLSQHAPKLWIIDAWGSTKVLTFNEHASRDDVSTMINPLVIEGLVLGTLYGANIKVEADEM